MSPLDDPSPRNPFSRPRLAEGVRLQPDRRDGGMVLLYPEGFLRLNRTAGEILGLCDGRRSIDEIVAMLADEYVEPAIELRSELPLNS